MAHINYFRNIRTEKGASERYRKLAMEHHPDRGGSETVMRDINGQYRALCERFEAEKARRRAEEAEASERTAHAEKTPQDANMKVENPPPKPKSPLSDLQEKIADIAAEAFTQIADVVIDEGASQLKSYIRRRMI